MFDDNKLPSWFRYPDEFHRVVDLNLTNLDPWYFLKGEQLEIRMAGLKERFPKADLVPFARRSDNDDVACWAIEGGNSKVYVIHDFSSWGWDKRKKFNSFWEWFRQAVEDMIEHES